MKFQEKIKPESILHISCNLNIFPQIYHSLLALALIFIGLLVQSDMGNKIALKELSCKYHFLNLALSQNQK